MSKFSKNLVLCGEADYHCLLCEESMYTEGDVEKHIRWEQHRKLMKDILYLPKYKTDCIIKIGDQFYCEICNILLTTTIKTALHIKEQSHITNKQTPNRDVLNKSDKIVRQGKDVKILNYIVNENEWNGIVDKQCLICDIDLDDIDNHFKRPMHVRKLIPSRIVFLDGDNFYRMIEGDIFYCFICKTPYSKCDLDSHFTSQEHINKKKKSDATLKSVNSNVNVNNGASTSKQSFNEEFKQNMKKMFQFTEKNNNIPTVSNENQDISSRVKEFQKEGIDINFEKSLAICRKCKFTPAYTVKAITEHIKMHKKAETNSPGFQIPEDSDEDWTTDSESDDTIGGDTIYSSDDEGNKENVTENVEEPQYIRHLDFGKIRSDLAKFGKDNHIKLINAGSKGHCTLCDCHISAHIKNFRQHIKGHNHVTNLQVKSQQAEQAKNQQANQAKKDDKNESKKPNVAPQPNVVPPKKSEYTTKPLKDYLRNLFFVKAMDDFWINRKLSVDKHSFALLCHLENNGKYDKIKCFLCDKTFASDDDQKHCQTPAHRNKIFDTKVITSIKKEFIREVRPNLFHCGFCNETTPSYETLKHHLRSYSHQARREQQELVADNTDDMWGTYLEDTQSAEQDILWNQLAGNRLL